MRGRHLRCTLARVTGVGRRPGWVVPSWHQVSDLVCLAMRAIPEGRSADCAGMVAATGWVRGFLAGPITGREDDPLLRPVALAELWAAAAVQPGWPTPPLRELCVMLRVAYRPPLDVDARYALGVWRTLRWLTGTEGEQPPLELPTRTADGRPATADQIYAGLVAIQGVVAREDAAALRAHAERTAARSIRLAALVTDAAQRARL